MKLLGEMIKAKTNDKTAPSTVDGVFENIHLLAEEKVSFGDEKVRWLALNTKKMIARMLDPSSFVNYEVKRSGNVVSCEARFYWSDDKEHPAGIGFVARDVTKRITSDADAGNAETEIEALVRGAAASRALTDAGIGIEFYSDSFDTLFSSVEEAEAEEVMQRKQTAKAEELRRLVPDVPTKAEIKKKARANNAPKEQAKTEEPAPQAPEKAPEPSPASTETVPEAKETEKMDDATEKPAEIATPNIMPETGGTINADEAKMVVTTKGNYAGQPLGLVQSARATALVWYAMNDTPEVGEAARTIIFSMNDEGLIERLNKAMNK